MTKTQKRWALGLGGALLLAIAGYFALTRVVDHYLNDGALAEAIGKKTAVILKADAGYLPLFWRGMTVRSGGLLVRGKPPRGLTELRASNLRASCSLHDLWQRKFVINRLQSDRLEVAFGAAAAAKLTPILSSEPELQPQKEMPSPLKLEIRETIVQQMSIFWGAQPEAIGGVREVLAKFYPNGSDLDGIGTGGTFQQTGWPELKIVRVEVHYAKPRLEIRSARFAIGKEEETSATGLLDLKEGGGGGMHFHVQTKGAPVEPFLKGFWRGKFEAKIEGDSRIDKEFKPDAKPTSAGELEFSDAEVHDVATLDRIAALTRHPEFAHLKLSELSGRYQWSGSQLEVTDLRMEAKKLFRVEGHFTIAEEEIDGSFHIGATADVLDSIPGAREKVFTRAHGGYFWTSMKLSGPLKHPREDLKERLVAAAKEKLAEGFLAPLFKPGKVVLGLLEALYQ
ncbi:MAG TPA: hypothetical protein VGL24_03720 [Chthoniobacterales bacterium]